jgi:hypothetical protein
MENHILWFFLPFWLYRILQYFTLFYTLGGFDEPLSLVKFP